MYFTGASGSHHAANRNVGPHLPDYAEVKSKKKPPRSHHGERESEGDRKSGERKRKKRRSERGSLHEELLEFISQEWASLDIAEVNA